MMIVAVDPSLRGTGVAVWRSRPETARGRALLFTVDGGKLGRDTNGWARAVRHQRVLAAVWPYVTGRRALAVVESGFHAAERSPDTTAQLAGLRAVLEYGLMVRRVPIAQLHNTKVKQYATGHGGASKTMMVDTAKGELVDLGDPEDDNQADALWLLAMALHHYQLRTPTPGPHTTLRAALLDGLTWPPLPDGGPA